MSISNSAKLSPWSSHPWLPPPHSGSGPFPAIPFSPQLSSSPSPARAAPLPLWSVLALLILLSSTQPHFSNHCQTWRCPTSGPPHSPTAHSPRSASSHYPPPTPCHLITPPALRSQGPSPQIGLHGPSRPHRDGVGCPHSRRRPHHRTHQPSTRPLVTRKQTNTTVM